MFLLQGRADPFVKKHVSSYNRTRVHNRTITHPSTECAHVSCRLSGQLAECLEQALGPKLPSNPFILRSNSATSKKSVSLKGRAWYVQPGSTSEEVAFGSCGKPFEDAPLCQRLNELPLAITYADLGPSFASHEIEFAEPPKESGNAIRSGDKLKEDCGKKRIISSFMGALTFSVHMSSFLGLLKRNSC